MSNIHNIWKMLRGKFAELRMMRMTLKGGKGRLWMICNIYPSVGQKVGKMGVAVNQWIGGKSENGRFGWLSLISTRKLLVVIHFVIYQLLPDAAVFKLSPKSCCSFSPSVHSSTYPCILASLHPFKLCLYALFICSPPSAGAVAGSENASRKMPLLLY